VQEGRNKACCFSVLEKQTHYGNHRLITALPGWVTEFLVQTATIPKSQAFFHLSGGHHQG